MLMINNIKNYLYDKKYFINLFDNYIHVFNYLKLLKFSNDEINLQLENFALKIKGQDLFITKMTNNELLIRGEVLGLEISKWTKD